MGMAMASCCLSFPPSSLLSLRKCSSVSVSNITIRRRRSGNYLYCPLQLQPHPPSLFRRGRGRGRGRVRVRKRLQQPLRARVRGRGRGVSSSKEEENSSVSPDLIWRAVKLPIYSVALVPLMVGSAAAYLQMHSFDAGRFCLFLFSSFLIITWLNLSNDVYDFDTGADKDKRESAVNISGSRSGVLYVAYICLVLGCGGLLWGGMQAGDVRIITLLFGAILCGYVYQGWRIPSKPIFTFKKSTQRTNVFVLKEKKRAHKSTHGSVTRDRQVAATAFIKGPMKTIRRCFLLT